METDIQSWSRVIPMTWVDSAGLSATRTVRDLGVYADSYIRWLQVPVLPGSQQSVQSCFDSCSA